MKNLLIVLVKAVLTVTVWGMVLETSLRLQQTWGPLYDLEMSGANLERYSDLVNHKPLRVEPRTFVGKRRYGDLDGFTYTLYFDENGLREYPAELFETGCERSVSALFFGDSFMQGYDAKNSIPYRIAKFLRTERNICLRVYNAGYWSYSPAIFVPLARELLPLVNPDYVVVDVDETDLYDDAIRYAKLITRDELGNNIGVKGSPILFEFYTGLIKAREHTLFIFRLAAKVWHIYFHMPAVKKNLRPDNRDVFSFSLDHADNLQEKYSAELFEFKHNLAELMEYLKYSMGGNDRILFVYHPHLRHLQPDEQGNIWNDLVSTTVESTARKNEILFFNATEELKKRFGREADQYYWKGDMHFNFKGLEEYSHAIANCMSESLIKEKR